MTDQTIICLANNYFFDPTSKHHVMRELARDNHVLWINWHASRRPSLNRRDFASIIEKLKQFRRGVVEVQERLWVLTPLVVPLPKWRVARWLNRKLVAIQVRQALRSLPPRRQLWSFTPDIIPLLGSFGEEVVVYYCVDEFAAFTGYNNDAIRSMDRELCERANLVVTTSEALYESKRGYNPNTIHVPHGVLYRHFAQALDRQFPVAADLEALPGPIIGYYGLIHDWQDLDLLAEVARRRPEWSIVLIGQVQVDIDRFRTVSNMHFLGRRPHAELPYFARGFDVAVIPHKLNELTRNMNPIKLREYLAAGLPVVASPLPEVRMYEPAVRVAQSADEWLKALDAAIRDRSPEADRRRSALVAEEDWSVKVRSIRSALNGLRGSNRGLASENRRLQAEVVWSVSKSLHNLLMIVSATQPENWTPTPRELEDVFRLKYASNGQLGWGSLLRRRFGYFTPDDIYESLVARLVDGDSFWLDIGCGRNLFPDNPSLSRLLAERAKLLVGVDPDMTIEENPYVHKRVRGTLDQFCPDRKYTLLTMRMVAEHIEDPISALKALAELAAPGGRVVVYTVNRWAPIALASAITPFRFRVFLKRLLWRTEDKDSFPVTYRMNTRKTLARLFGDFGFREVHFAYLDDCRTFARFRLLHRFELGFWRLLRALGLRYPETCLLGTYERIGKPVTAH
jgi:glycosyltransferase involved in cell wall biosynthesis